MRNPLGEFAKNEFSQFGEDGITKRIFEILPAQNKYWCVEFGAWDGKHLSNTHYLVSQCDWSGVFIEGDQKKFPDLQATYHDNNNAHLVNKLVAFEGEDLLDNILAETPIPYDFDVLSIDIDSNDYHVWESVQNYSPKLVIIEFNPTIPSDIEFIQEKDFSLNHGNSLLSICLLAKTKGYQLVATTVCNGFFIRNDLFSYLNIEKNEIQDMWTTELPAPRIFQLYDGTIVLTESFRLKWASKYVDRNVSQYDLQKLKRSQRYYHGSPTRLWKRLWLRFTHMVRPNP